VEQAEVEAEQVLKNSLETLDRLAQQLRRGPITGTAVRLIMEELVVGRRGMLNMADETNAAARGVDQTTVDQINLDLAQFHSAEVETLLLKNTGTSKGSSGSTRPRELSLSQRKCDSNHFPDLTTSASRSEGS